MEETEDLYGEILRIEFKAFLRAEKKFCNTEELFLQIKKDGEQSKEVLEDQ